MSCHNDHEDWNINQRLSIGRFYQSIDIQFVRCAIPLLDVGLSFFCEVFSYYISQFGQPVFY